MARSFLGGEFAGGEVTGNLIEKQGFVLPR